MKDSTAESHPDVSPSIDELLSLTEAAALSGLSASHLRLLVRRGESWGQELGRSWYSTERAVNAYIAKEHKPGPKRK